MRRVFSKCDKCGKLIDFNELIEMHCLHVASNEENQFTVCNDCYIRFITEFMGIRIEHPEETSEVENNETE